MKALFAPVIWIQLIFAQSAPESYMPLIPGSTWTYQTQDGKFEDRLESEKFIHKNMEYFPLVRKYADGTVEISYYRQANNSAIIYLDTKSWLESEEIPALPRINKKWRSTDTSWDYEIVDMKATLKTPARTYQDCLVIKCKNRVPGSDWYGMPYLSYYVRGIGFVGTTIDGKLDTYLVKYHLNQKKT